MEKQTENQKPDLSVAKLTDHCGYNLSSNFRIVRNRETQQRILRDQLVTTKIMRYIRQLLRLRWREKREFA